MNIARKPFIEQPIAGRPSGPASNPSGPAGAHLSGRRLIAMRWSCGLLVTLALALFIIALPARLAELRAVALQSGPAVQQLSPPAQQALLKLGLSLKQYPFFALAVEIGLMALLSFSAAIIWWRRSDDWVALFLVVAQVTYGLFVTPPLDALMAARPMWQLPGNLMQAFGLGCALLFFYIFPDGRFVPRWTQGLVFLWLGWGLVWVIFPKTPLNLGDPFNLSLVWFLVLMLWWATGIFAQLHRFRRVSNPVVRQQTKYILFGLILAVLGYGFYVPARYILPRLDAAGLFVLIYELIGIHLFLIAVFCVPLAITFSILRYRLWDIDVIINRTLVYSAFTALLAVIYFGTVVILQLFFRPFTGQHSPLAGVVSTLALAALFNPLRRRVQTLIDRRFYRQKYDAARTLAAFGATLRQEVDLPKLIEGLETVIWETIQPAFVVTWLRGPSGFGLYLDDRAEVGAEIPVDDPLVDYLQTAVEVVPLDRIDLDSPAVSRLKFAQARLIVPLICSGELAGWFCVGPRLSQQGYSTDDQALLNSLAAQAGPAVCVAQLVSRQQAEALERERLDQELAVAHLIQQTLLPQELPTLPGWEVATYWQPARAVGGDFYDFLPLPDGQLVIVAGDVADKGVPAALVMATTRAILRGCARRQLSPGAALARANELLYPETPAQMFVTCLYAILEPAGGRFWYANAGHNLPCRRGRSGVTELWASGMPLGMMPGISYDEYETTIEPGECLLLYSDGLVEARNAQRELFGFAQLQTLLGPEASFTCGQRLIEQLLAELTRFTGPGWQQEDDVTLVTLERAVSRST